MEKLSKQSVISNWVNLYTDALFSWAMSKTSNKEAAEDLVQDTIIAAMQGYEKYEELSNPKTWLFSILNHKITDYHRSKFRSQAVFQPTEAEHFFDEKGKWKRDEMPKDWHENQENLLDNDEFRKELQKCLNKLPSSWFSIIQMKYLQEIKSDEICQDLGINMTNLWQIIHRSKLLLRKCIELGWFK
jgi:RNA polymerase sigma-70 factor (ECF subfamily)